MKQTTSLKIAILICLSIWATTSFAQKSIEKDSVGSETFYVAGRSNIEIGVFIPTGSLSKFLNPCPNIGYYFGLQITRKCAIDFGANYFRQLNPKSFNYKQGDSLVVGKPTTSAKLGVWISSIEKINTKYTWENRFGFGVSVLQSNIKKNNCNNSKDEFESSGSSFFNLGTTIRKKIKNGRDFGFRINYFITKYDLFDQDLTTGKGNRNKNFTMSISYGSNR